MSETTETKEPETINRGEFLECLTYILGKIRLIEKEIEKTDSYIKLTGYNHEPLYVKMDCITRMRWIDDIDPYTRIYSAGGDFSVRETPEQIMESLGYRKEQNDA